MSAEIIINLAELGVILVCAFAVGCLVGLWVSR